ncbi:RNA polymerase sigma factor [Haloferula sp.]|uniref:RNA polymerase sigma factor n=1 Tax=Haloferula sp. TaxID=2497595 RepID=UPI00329D40DA
MEEPNLTKHTLLQRACDPGNDRAWEEFVQNYRRFILYILGQLGVDQDDVEDVTQQILLALTRDLPRYDRTRARFRTWLSTVIRNAALVHFRTLKNQRTRLEVLEDDPSISKLTPEPEISRLIEVEWSTYISNLAMERVREVFQGEAVHVFELGLDGHSAATIAQQTGLSVASVYTLRKRVKKRLYLEIRAVVAELEP